MSTNTYTISDVPIPAKFTADAWQDDAPMPYRILFGSCSTLAESRSRPVQATAVQYADRGSAMAACTTGRTCISATTPSPAHRRP
jgi:hypothetical protein